MERLVKGERKDLDRARAPPARYALHLYMPSSPPGGSTGTTDIPLCRRMSEDGPDLIGEPAKGQRPALARH